MSDTPPTAQVAPAPDRALHALTRNASSSAARESVRQALVLLLLAAVCAFAFQGTRHLWEPDEGRYTNVALRMVQTGDWINPSLDEEHLHFTKPPLTYWLIGASYRLFGINEWAARLPNALAFMLTALLVFGIAQVLVPQRALLAAAIWTTLLGPVAGANVVSTDTLLALWETLALFAFVRSGALSERPIERWHIVLMWIAFALAFLTKGPPGLLPLGGIIAWLIWMRRAGELRRLFASPGLLAFLLLGGSWFCVVVARDPSLLSYFLGTEVAGRVVSPAFDRNSGWLGWLKVYVPTLAIGLLPWAGLWLLRRARTGASWRTSMTDPVTRFLLCWIAVPLLIFCLAQSRLPLYLLPLFVPISLLIARALPQSMVDRKPVVVATIVAAAVFAMSLKAIAAHVNYGRDGERIATELAGTVNMSLYEEVVFLDMPPAYSLHHYLGVEVERVSLTAGTIPETGREAFESLCSELHRSERFLLVTKASRAPAVALAARQCSPAALNEVGRMRDWVLWSSVQPRIEVP